MWGLWDGGVESGEVEGGRVHEATPHASFSLVSTSVSPSALRSVATAAVHLQTALLSSLTTRPPTPALNIRSRLRLSCQDGPRADRRPSPHATLAPKRGDSRAARAARRHSLVLLAFNCHLSFALYCTPKSRIAVTSSWTTLLSIHTALETTDNARYDRKLDGDSPAVTGLSRCALKSAVFLNGQRQPPSRLWLSSCFAWPTSPASAFHSQMFSHDAKIVGTRVQTRYQGQALPSLNCSTRGDHATATIPPRSGERAAPCCTANFHINSAALSHLPSSNAHVRRIMQVTVTCSVRLRL
ncbi:hypothetical protein JOL62DRAFT_143243 [Phyllosticta paracitricarpa]|uniref:Uncharacterized protein n=1 Tax=Phyllosticta paracitricarpa TaxID=2016321 RepID=A0ABR1NIX9_9PEZI